MRRIAGVAAAFISVIAVAATSAAQTAAQSSSDLPPGVYMGGKELADARAGTYTIDPDHTAVFARVQHIGYSWSVFRFDRASGKLRLGSGGAGEVDAVGRGADSVDRLAVKDFAAQLAGDEYLKSAKFPEATFVSTAFHRSDATHGKVDGQFTLMGMTKPVTFDVELVGAGKGWADKPRLGVHAVARIVPQDYRLPGVVREHDRDRRRYRVREGAMNVALKPGEQALELVRELKAPRERVFAAWIDPEQAARWWVPQDCDAGVVQDGRAAGRRLAPAHARAGRRRRSPSGASIARSSSPERLVFTYNTEYADGTVDPETLVTVTLEDLGRNRTRLTLRHERFWSEPASISHTGGWTGALNRLAAVHVGGVSSSWPSGFSRERLARLHHALAAHVAAGDMPGVVALVSRRGEVHVEAVGTQSFGGAPMRRDTIFRIASMTKPVIAAATLMLVEECKLRLDDPVDAFLPELANRKVLKSLDEPGRGHGAGAALDHRARPADLHLRHGRGDGVAGQVSDPARRRGGRAWRRARSSSTSRPTSS